MTIPPTKHHDYFLTPYRIARFQEGAKAINLIPPHIGKSEIQVRDFLCGKDQL
jgi:hypothetical protein